MEIGSALFRIVLLYGGIIGVCIALIVFFRARGRKQAQEKRRARKEALQPATSTAGDTPSLASLMNERDNKRHERAVYQAETDDDSGLDDLFSGEYKPHTPADTHASDDSITADGDFEIDDDLDIAELVSAIDAAEAETTSADTPHTIGDRPLTIQLSDGTRTQAIEAMSILRDERDGRLIVQMSDTGYRTLRHDKTVRKAFARLMKELAQSVKQADDLSDTPPASDTPAQAPTPPPAKPAEPAPPQAPQQRDTADDALPGDLPEYRLSDMETNYKRNRYGRLEVKEVQKVEEVNIADAIEAYLQHKISQTPRFQKRGIHVRPALIGVTIEADGETYDSVDAVDDEDVKTFLKETIAEWQARNSPR